MLPGQGTVAEERDSCPKVEFRRLAGLQLARQEHRKQKNLEEGWLGKLHDRLAIILFALHPYGTHEWQEIRRIRENLASCFATDG